MHISIHAPTRGATFFTSGNKNDGIYFNPRSHERSDKAAGYRLSTGQEFQSTLPREERRRQSYCITQGNNISIHAPTRGATLLPPVMQKFQGFQSTLPREERRVLQVDCIYHSIFQSTLPREERQRPEVMKFILFMNFNPRSHERSDDTFRIIFFFTLHFNPRSHERSDKSHSGRLKGCADFNPRSHERSDCCDRLASALVIYFNPRSHERSD